MKTKILIGLCIALIAGFISVRAEDNPDQAAARAALEHKMYELDHPATQTPADPDPVTTVAAQPAESTPGATNTVSAAAATTPAADPTTEVPATVAATEATPAPTAPAGSNFVSEISLNNTPAQAAALAALEQKMHELDHAATQPSVDTNSAAEIATTPVTETPAAEVPAAKSPQMASVAVTPASAAPAVVTPTPKVSTTSPSAATTRVAAVPAAGPGPVATPPPQTPPAPTLPSSSPGKRPVNELVTTTGVTYKNVEVLRVVSDGIFISYVPMHGGWAMTRVPFKDLPSEIRKQYEKP